MRRREQKYPGCLVIKNSEAVLLTLIHGVEIWTYHILSWPTIGLLTVLANCGIGAPESNWWHLIPVSWGVYRPYRP